jgi:hypothetical protein
MLSFIGTATLLFDKHGEDQYKYGTYVLSQQAQTLSG